MSAGDSGGYIGHGAVALPVQIELVGSRSARFIVLMSGRRTFSTPWPGKLPRYASSVLIVSIRAAKARRLTAFSTRSAEAARRSRSSSISTTTLV